MKQYTIYQTVEAAKVHSVVKIGKRKFHVYLDEDDKRDPITGALPFIEMSLGEYNKVGPEKGCWLVKREGALESCTTEVFRSLVMDECKKEAS